jgi:hypothetical protein|tara:strand:+ start:4050 stop:4937 length:888 start_codon:yes stop_codon:yes gene_type:complete
MSFANLKRNRSSIGDLVAAATPETKSDKKSYKDDRQWKPTVDKAGNGYAVVRFLPGLDGNVPFVRYWDHGFKGPTGQWYIERSLTSIGQQDPVSEMNSELWATETDDNRAIVRERKRRLHYVANIIVESDPSNPENEGKVFLYTFGKKIFDKVMDMMQPQFQDEEPVNPFDFWEGASFKLKIRNVEGYRNYDKSEFASPTPLSEDEAELESVYDKLYDLNEFTDPASYKTYDELKTRLQMVLGEVPRAQIPTVQAVALEEVRDPAPMRSSAAPEPRVSEGDEDTMSFFAKLANED